MTKEQLIKQISAETKISKDTTAAIVESLFDCVKTSIVNGENVYLVASAHFRTSCATRRTSIMPLANIA